MKKTIIILLIIGLLFFSFAAYNSSPGLALYNLSKKGGIEYSKPLKYRVYLLGFLPIAEAVIYSEEPDKFKGKDVFLLRARAESLHIFSSLFKASALIESYVDRESRDSLFFKQYVFVSGKGEINKEIAYDQENLIMTIEGTERKILPHTRDPLGALLNLKYMDLDNLEAVKLNVNTNQKNYILEGAIENWELSLNGSIFKLTNLKTNIRRQGKSPYHRSNVNIVLVRGAENIPILIKVFTNGFLVVAKLIQ